MAKLSSYIDRISKAITGFWADIFALLHGIECRASCSVLLCRESPLQRFLRPLHEVSELGTPLYRYICR